MQSGQVCVSDYMHQCMYYLTPSTCNLSMCFCVCVFPCQNMQCTEARVFPTSNSWTDETAPKILFNMNIFCAALPFIVNFPLLTFMAIRIFKSHLSPCRLYFLVPLMMLPPIFCPKAEGKTLLGEMVCAA